MTRFVKRQSATAFVISEQARDALKRLGKDDISAADPRIVLLDSVRSAHRQRQIWELMLEAVPEEDWAAVGTPPIPGSTSANGGARIETIQRFLAETTKVAARTSKLAIDAGIEDRLVRLAEEQSALIADTVRAALVAAIGTLRLSPHAEAKAIESALGSAATHLRTLAAGGGDQIIVEAVTKSVNTRSRP